MRLTRFTWRWLWIWALGALAFALALRQWGGYWHITRWARPLPPREAEAPKKEEAPPVQGEVSEDTRKAMEKHLEAEKQARRPPH